MQKQGFYFARHCCCTNARLLGKYPGHQFGKLELKKNSIGIGISIGIGRIAIGIGIVIGIENPIGIAIDNPIRIPFGIGIAGFAYHFCRFIFDCSDKARCCNHLKY